MKPNAMPDLSDLSTVEMAEAIRTRQLSAVEAVEASLEKIDRHKDLNAFMALCPERARDEARRADAALMRDEAVGPLHGAPFTVKDLTNTQGVATTQGSALFAEAVPAEDAVVVARARAAGAILIGKTTTPEFGHKPFTEGPFFGRTLNPWNPEATCGGSSGGAAASVAAGITPFALGTDGGGSVRIPAACCGIAGFKATLGAIPNLQPPDLFGANSYVGPMALRIADVRLVFETLRGPDQRDPFGQGADRRPAKPGPGEPVRIGWMLSCGNPVDPDVRRLTEAAMKTADRSGFTVEPVELDFVSLEKHFLVLLRSLLRARLLKHRIRNPGLLDPTLVATIDAAESYSAVDLCEAQFARTDCFTAVQGVLQTVDIIASPTLSAPPLPVGLDPHSDIEIAGRNAGTIRGAWYPYTYPYNLTGHPAVTLPCGLSGSGLPVGLQLVGRWHEDGLVLDTAERLETAMGLDLRPPAETGTRG